MQDQTTVLLSAWATLMLGKEMQLQDGDPFRRYDTIAIPQNV
jgi:hypothetical protein